MARLKLDKVLEDKGITKYAFAKALDLEPPNVRPFFQKGYNPKLQTLAAWSIAIGCKISDLFDVSKDVPKGVKRANRTAKKKTRK